MYGKKDSVVITWCFMSSPPSPYASRGISMTPKRDWVVICMSVCTAVTGLKNKHRSAPQRVKKQRGEFCLPMIFYSQLLQPSPRKTQFDSNKHYGWPSLLESICLPGSRDLLCKPGFCSVPTLKLRHCHLGLIPCPAPVSAV